MSGDRSRRLSRGPSAASAPVRLETENEWAWCGSRRLRLTPRAFGVLRHLVEHAGRLVTKDELFTAIWRDTIVSEDALASCIRDLRRALGDPSRAPRYIETVHRRGFRFIGPLAPSSALPRRPTPERVGPAPGVARPLPSARMLVGRETDLARLHALLADALGGQRGLVFVTGEPGIGKTSLADAFLGEIDTASGVLIARGQCVEQYGAGEAYLPVLEALGRLGREASGERVVQALRQHAPTWLVQLPTLLDDRELESVQRRAQGASRARMLRELVEALDALTVQCPLVLVLEDLHWSDASTIDLLTMLARRSDTARLLVLGTYRPADLAVSDHPLKAAKRELALHGHCEEVALEFLSVSAVAEYLSRRFGPQQWPPDFAPMLNRQTDGNPLFLVTTIDLLLAQGQLRDVDGRWVLSAPVKDLALHAPVTLSQMVDKQFEQLTEDEQAMLTIGAVAGAEFSAAIAVAHGIDLAEAERRCEALAQRGQFLRSTGVAEWPDGTVAGRYAFIHALYQRLIYARIPAGHRAELHLRTGARLEQAHEPRTREIAGELAVHFEQGRAGERAARYRRLAGEHALGRHAYREAADHARRALDLLNTTSDTPERDREELMIQVLLAAALTTTHSWAAPEVAQAFARARALCERAGDAAQLWPVLHGLMRFYLVRGQLSTARDVAGELLAAAETTPDPAPALAAHNVLGLTAFHAGEFAEALIHFDRAMALYDPALHSPSRSAVFRVGQDPAVSCTVQSALGLWMLGYPRRAVARMQEGLALARSLDHPFSLSYSCHFASFLYQWLADRRAVQTLQDESVRIDTEHGFGLFLIMGAAFRGWLLAESGHGHDGLAQMLQAAVRARETGVELFFPAFLALIAGVQETLGLITDGLATVSEGLVTYREASCYWEAELLRLRGELTLRMEAPTGRDASARRPRAGGRPHLPAAGTPATKEAEAIFLQAIAVARRQQAKSLELRAATSLGRLWASQGKTAEARSLLGEIYDWFTEGLDTADLIEARSLLTQLGR
jgi:DNA-binding winged helix-turn-helix (wHTH) protein/predicted ATPase